MPRDHEDEFSKIEKMFRRALESTSMSFGSVGYSVSIKKTGDKTRVEMHGNVPEEEMEKVRKRYPDAEIYVDGNKVEGSGPVEVLEEGEIDEKVRGSPQVEEIDEEEMEASELALKRFEEKKKDKE